MSRWWFWRRVRCRLFRHHEAVIGIIIDGSATAYCGCGREVKP